MNTTNLAKVILSLSLALGLAGCGSGIKGFEPKDSFSKGKEITTLPFTTSTDTTKATANADDPIPSCGDGGTANSVWSHYTATNDDTIIADTVRSNYDTVLSVWTGSPGSFSEVWCNDDDFVSFTFQSRLFFAGISGTTYHFMTTSFDGTGGNLVFNLDSLPAPANDDFANSTTISSLPFNSSINTEGGTLELSDPISGCDSGLDIPTVWYKYTPAADEMVTASTAGSTYDTVLSVWTGSPGSFGTVACNDDSVGTESVVTFSATGGVTYHFLVASFFGDGGNLSFNVSVTP